MQHETITPFQEHQIQWDSDKISRLWNYYSRTPPYSNAYFSKLFGRQILRLSGLALTQPLHVVDFGCGPGFIWEHLVRLRSAWRYTGLDFSLDSINKVVEKANGHRNFAGAYHISSVPTHLPGAHFDVVLLLEVVEHLSDSDLNGTLTEVSRLLKPGGVVVISTPNEENLSDSNKFCPECGAIYHEWQHVRAWSVGTLAAQLKQHDFVLRVAETLDFSTQGVSVLSALRLVKRLARKLLGIGKDSPHMLTVFQKT